MIITATGAIAGRSWPADQPAPGRRTIWIPCSTLDEASCGCSLVRHRGHHEVTDDFGIFRIIGDPLVGTFGLGRIERILEPIGQKPAGIIVQGSSTLRITEMSLIAAVDLAAALINN